MPTDIDREEVRRLVEQGARLVEVLGAKAYAAEHLPGAINIPLSELNRDAVAHLERDRPLVIYCYDGQ